MSSSPVKMFAFAGLAAAMVAGMVSQHVEQAQQPAAVPAAPVVRPAAAPAIASMARGFGSVAIKRDNNGHYQAQIEIDGLRIPMLVDTGATIVALRSEDAERVGLNPAPSAYNAPISTANGQIMAARITLREVRLDNITVSNVPAVIMPRGALSQSLLGMSFMNKLSKFEIADGELVLKP